MSSVIFIQARNYTPCAERLVDLIVIHTAETLEAPKVALGVANFFRNQKAGPDGSSAHYAVDNLRVVQCVKDHDIAWAAPGANRNGLHIEHAGRAAQNAKEWADPYSTAMLKLSAVLAAEKAGYYGIPVRRLTPAQLKAGLLGFCGHIDVTRAFPGGSHVDPGPAFPWTRYLSCVRSFQRGVWPT